MALQIVTSNFAVEQDGYEDKEIEVSRGSFWQRVFDPDPYAPLWQKTKKKIVKVPHYKPVIYRVLDKLIVHPLQVEQIRAAFESPSKPDRVYRW